MILGFGIGTILKKATIKEISLIPIDVLQEVILAS